MESKEPWELEMSNFLLWFGGYLFSLAIALAFNRGAHRKSSYPLEREAAVDDREGVLVTT